jgi:hypothetical protein
VPALQDIVCEPVYIAFDTNIRKQSCCIQHPFFPQPDEIADIMCYQLGDQLLLLAEFLSNLHLERLLEKNIQGNEYGYDY